MGEQPPYAEEGKGGREMGTNEMGGICFGSIDGYCRPAGAAEVR